MPLVVGVSFQRAGKVYYFDPNGIALHKNDCVIAETARGIEFGEVVMEPKEVPDAEIISPLKKVARRAARSWRKPRSVTNAVYRTERRIAC